MYKVKKETNMKSLEEHLIERYGGKFTIEQLVEGRIPKLFLKIEAVKKEIKKLEAERKAKFGGDYAKQVNAEKDPSKRAKLLKPIQDISKKIAAQQKNLADMLDMEDKYISQMGMDQELDTSVFEDVDLGHQDNEPGMLRADLSIIERYADELGDIMEELENSGKEIDLPHWWQTKIIKAKDYLVGAKHYLRAELEKNN